jgi:hypothetical protein
MSTGPTLAESLAIIVPHLPTALFPPNAMADIHALASVLPAIPRTGFECRLGGQVTPVDFQQGISHDGGEPAILLAHLEAPPYPSDQLLNPVWHRLRDFAARWTDPTSPIHTGVEQVWLEFDMDGGPSLL